ncbi:hypothetical protein LCGC14_0394070 [marine sediment metagenome]|uniref:Uncharacterized protein n=1 Tax=marine sediment metagenome TaxID=412755 RepID=A0A0F9TGN7_9ZZZZ
MSVLSYGWFRKTVAASGTPEALKPNAFKVLWWTLTPIQGNSGANVYVGSDDMPPSSNAYPLTIGEHFPSPLSGGQSVLHAGGLRDDLNKIQIDVDTSADGVIVLYASYPGDTP